jgi:hypothetical protein
LNESVTKCEGSKVAGERRRSRIGIGIGEEAVARKGRGLIESELQFLMLSFLLSLIKYTRTWAWAQPDFVHANTFTHSGPVTR